MNFEILALYIISVFTFIVTPGPVVALVLRNASFGLKNAFLTILGTNFASLLLIGVASAVIMGTFKIGDGALNLLAFFGSLFIIYLGVSSLLADLKSSTEAEQNQTKKAKNSFLQGFGVAISNPKDIIFFTAFFPQFIAVTPSVGLSLAVLVVVWIVMDFSLLLSYSLLMGLCAVLKYKFQISLVSDIVLIIIGVVGAIFCVMRF